MRCITLAESLKKKFASIFFISNQIPRNLADFIEDEGFKVYNIDGYTYIEKQRINSTTKKKLIENDVSQTREIIQSYKNTENWLIIDHYGVDKKWESKIRKYVEKIIVIDDLVNRKHSCDVIIDQNFYKNMKKRYENLVPRDCIQLEGPKYALLRSEFKSIRKKLKRKYRLCCILVSFGGSDPRNETAKALQAIKILNGKSFTVDVVVGNINPHKEKIKHLCSSIPNTTFYSNVDDIGELMSKAHLAIGAGGSTTWERCCLGLPSIVSIISDDQAEVIKLLAKKNCVINLGNFQNLTHYDYVEAIKSMNNKTIAKMSSNCMKIVDGLGCFRVAEIINSL